MPYPVHSVERYDRRTRRTLATAAAGLTLRSASRLAETLRRESGDDSAGFRVATMPLDQQADLLASGEAMSTLRLAA